MNKQSEVFRDNLLELEKTNPVLKEKYEKQVQALIEKKLTLSGKLTYSFVALIALVFGLWYGAVGILGLMKLPLSARIVFTILAVVCMFFTGLVFWTIKSGSIKLKVQPLAITGMIWAFVVIIIIGLMAKGIRLAEPTWTIQSLVYAIVFLIIASLLFSGQLTISAIMRGGRLLPIIKLEVCSLIKKV